MKRLVLITSILFVCMSCGYAQNTKQSADDIARYEVPWNTPTVSAKSFDYKYCRFGMIDPFIIGEPKQREGLPPIPGLKHKTRYVVCPKDSCYADYSIIAYRCPDDQKLLEWVGSKTEDFLNQYSPRSCDSVYRLEDEPVVTDQWGTLIVDCWKTGDYYTFYELSWRDYFLSSGNNTWEDYYTVDSRTGKELVLEDLVSPSKYGKLNELMLKYLRNDGDGYLYVNDEPLQVPAKEVLQQLCGCALIREGMILYFHPYVLSCGAAGSFSATIPYSKLRGILKPEFLRMAV